jgi:hypothetical protein
MGAGNRVVATYRNEMEALLARGLLETAGIAAFILKDDGGGMVPSLQRWTGVRLAVAEADLERAREILAANSLEEGEA